MKSTLKHIVAAGAFATLAACANPLAPGPQPSIYAVNPKLEIPAAVQTMALQITVEEPTAPSALDTDRVPGDSTGDGMKFESGVRFADRIPVLMKRNLIRGLEQAGAFEAVASDTLGLRTPYNIAGDIRHFGVRDGMASVGVSIAILDKREASIVARQTVVGTAPLSSPMYDAGGNAMVSAYQAAVAEVVRKAVPFISTAIAAAAKENSN